MIRLIAFAAFALAVATSAQAMSPAPLNQPEGMTTRVVYGCGPFRTRVNGVCVARTTKRQVRRCARWNGGCLRVSGTETPTGHANGHRVFMRKIKEGLAQPAPLSFQSN